MEEGWRKDGGKEGRQGRDGGREGRKGGREGWMDGKIDEGMDSRGGGNV